MAFGLSVNTSASTRGTIWVGNLHLPESQTLAESPEIAEPTSETAEESEEASTDELVGGFPCIGALTFPLGVVGLYLSRQRK